MRAVQTTPADFLEAEIRHSGCGISSETGGTAMRAWLAVAILMLGASCDARAEQASAPEPVLRVTLDPPRVVVGQRTTLGVEVLAPNYMTAPPELPGFQIRNAVTRPLQSVNINEQEDGNAYAGVRFEFAIYPQEPGSYAMADQKVSIKYATEPPSTREIEMPLPRVSFEAFIPGAAAGLRPFLAATGLTIEQTVQRSSDQLKSGDAITRTVIIKAEDVPAMLLPPQKFAAVDGLALYPAQPNLEDKTLRTNRYAFVHAGRFRNLHAGKARRLFAAGDRCGLVEYRFGKDQRRHISTQWLLTSRPGRRAGSWLLAPGAGINFRFRPGHSLFAVLAAIALAINCMDLAARYTGNSCSLSGSAIKNI